MVAAAASPEPCSRATVTAQRTCAASKIGVYMHVFGRAGEDGRAWGACDDS